MFAALRVKMKQGAFSKTGITLVVVYLLISISLIVYAQFITDPKSKFIFLQLPIVFQHALLLELNLTNYLENISWPTAYLILMPPMMLSLYLFGHFLGHILTKAIQIIRNAK